MKIKTKELIAELIENTKTNINNAEEFRSLSDNDLNYKDSTEEWSILECIEHLNLYGDFYNPAIKESIEKTKTSYSDFFKSGLIGNYFVNMMIPKEKLNKMKTFKDKNPLGSKLNKSVLDRFINQQKEFLELIENSKNISFTKTKTPISISRFLKLRLGDTFRFVNAHNKRHLLQAKKILKTISS
ncbi:DinB family protein [uncultured Lutibacter sp.]|uniref:DinB family protein n=1 Tax=uncultured Lutibacter sp. TaxID=437739 RepID=UPI00261C4794|nr:DinB family protein [uncultured Lutibacter sp.]